MLNIRYEDVPGRYLAGNVCAIVEGPQGATILIDEGASAQQRNHALSTTIGAWAAQRWVFVGDCLSASPPPAVHEAG